MQAVRSKLEEVVQQELFTILNSPAKAATPTEWRIQNFTQTVNDIDKTEAYVKAANAFARLTNLVADAIEGVRGILFKV